MPRPPRLHVPGGCYHTILRGNHREALFGSAADRHLLNEIVADVLGRFGARIHAFCWMSNHLHALIQIADRPLGQIMQRIAMRYSRRRHKELRTCGHLFERRYKARLVDVDAYFLTLVRYIHRNPVKAGIVADPAAYPWSSHRAYLGRQSIPWLTTHFGLSLISARLDRARRAYARFVAEPDDPNCDNLDDESHPRDSRILGTDSFISSIRVAVDRPRGSTTLEQLAAKICETRRADVQVIRSRSAMRRLTPIRLQIARAAIEQRIATLTEVARYLNRDPSTLCKLMSKHSVTIQ
jgi:putative transposase